MRNVLFVLAVLVLAGCIGEEPVACAMDAMECPDGSFVGRVAPDCEFAPCPPATTMDCTSHYWMDGSSTECGYKEFCGAYMYPGLRTFETLAECEAALGGSALPEGHDCYFETDRSLQNAIAIKDCFMERGEYVECVYFMLKHAQIGEQTGNLDAGWSMRLYSKSIDCAKAAEELPNANLLPPRMSIMIGDYYEFYAGDGLSVVTTEQLAQVVEDLSKIRNEFL